MQNTNISLSKEQMQEIFFSSLCNAISTGVTLNYGIKVYSEKEDYLKAKESFLSQCEEGRGVCIEDVWMQILKDGGHLYSKDYNGDSSYNKKINLNDVYEGIKKVDNNTILNFLEENDDADDADVVIQTVFFGEVIFG